MSAETDPSPDGETLAGGAKREAAFRLSAEDYIAYKAAFRRTTHARRTRRVMLWVALIAFAAATAYNVVMDRDFAMAVVWATYGALLFAYLTRGGERLERFQFARTKLGEQDVVFGFDDRGFAYSSPPLISARGDWADVGLLDVTDDHAFIWPNEQAGYIVPLRAFADPAEAAAFVALAKEKTAGKTFM